MSPIKRLILYCSLMTIPTLLVFAFSLSYLANNMSDALGALGGDGSMSNCYLFFLYIFGPIAECVIVYATLRFMKRLLNTQIETAMNDIEHLSRLKNY